MSRHDRSRDRGGLSTEMAIVMVPVLAGFMLLVVYAGRLSQARTDVNSAAQEAARAASLTNSADQAAEAAARTVIANLRTAGLGCAGGPTVTTDASSLTPGGTVTVTVTCTVALGDLITLRVPGTTQLSARSTEVVDRYRSGP